MLLLVAPQELGQCLGCDSTPGFLEQQPNNNNNCSPLHMSSCAHVHLAADKLLLTSCSCCCCCRLAGCLLQARRSRRPVLADAAQQAAWEDAALAAAWVNMVRKDIPRAARYAAAQRMGVLQVCVCVCAGVCAASMVRP